MSSGNLRSRRGGVLLTAILMTVVVYSTKLPPVANENMMILEQSLEDDNETSKTEAPQQVVCFSGCSETSHQSFSDAMRSFPWIPYKAALDAWNSSSSDVLGVQRYSTQLLLNLIPFLNRPPRVPINKTCTAPAHKMPSSPECKPLPKPRKVGILWQFGFDVDALEIHLNELDSVVDKFFILESIKAHSKMILSKPLLWESLKYDERFAKFSNKIVHLIVDDASLSLKGNSSDIWSRELLQEQLRWRKFLEWNDATGYFSNEDLLGFGDVDEVPARDNVFYLKNCKMPGESVDIGIWFPYDGMDTAYRSDFPVTKAHSRTLGDPTFWTLDSAKKYQERTGSPPSRMRGKSDHHLLGGMHLSRYAYPPFQMVKHLTATESDGGNVQTVIEVGMMFAQNKSEEAGRKLNAFSEKTETRIVTLDEFRRGDGAEADAIVKVPWFLQCNLGRYPGFRKRWDSRLDSSPVGVV